MECPKCEGLMIEEYLADGSGGINEWRCVNCGAILDAVIAQNQLRRSTRGRASTKGASLSDERLALFVSVCEAVRGAAAKAR
jgi:hypothetical protein